jgi:hypothetical protein
MEIAHVQEVSTRMQAWLRDCPSPAEFKAAFERAVFLTQMGKCYQCGTEAANKDLRPDDAYFGGGEDICKSCYTLHNGGTPACPGFHAEWPPERTEKPSRLVDGDLWENGSQIGTVEGYDFDRHFARRVTLFAYPDSGESGSLDPGCTVVARACLHNPDGRPHAGLAPRLPLARGVCGRRGENRVDLADARSPAPPR